LSLFEYHLLLLLNLEPPPPKLTNKPLPACRTLESAKKLSAGVKLATPISLDVNDDKALDAAVAQHDVVISLIPYTYHAAVIKSAIRNKKNVVTTSYVSPAMMELDQQAKDAGITVMNEIGVSGKPTLLLCPCSGDDN
jgi:saccharopine dehydrogenase-like NADP-dependent oxidoreductase